MIFVYQETPLPGQLSKISVLNTALLDFLPGQVNTVNVECAGELETLEFSEKSTTSRVEIDFSACQYALVPAEALRHGFPVGKVRMRCER